jgi:Ala-tRNA(Pro) deacylase
MNTPGRGEDKTMSEITENEEKLLAALKELGIRYQYHSHPPVYTVEEAQEYWSDIEGAHPKNLFLRDAKGTRHFLVIAEHSKKVDLKELQQVLGSSRLSFASERRLQEHLGLSRGAVSGFGVLNDGSKEVEVILDRSLLEQELINFHPNANTATLTITVQDYRRFLEHCGNPVRYVTL